MSTDLARTWLAPKQIAAELGCSRDTVLRAIHRGALPAIQEGRVIRVAPADLEAYLAAIRTGNDLASRRRSTRRYSA